MSNQLIHYIDIRTVSTEAHWALIDNQTVPRQLISPAFHLDARVILFNRMLLVELSPIPAHAFRVRKCGRPAKA